MEKKMNGMSRLLVHEEPLLVLPKLAEEIGLNEAIFLQQVHYWLQKSKYIYDGRRWVYNTYVEWTKQFPFWSISTVRRIIGKLEKSGLLLSDNYNTLLLDKTKWYAIDYDVLNKMKNPFAQSEALKCPSSEVEVPVLDNSDIQFDQSNTIDSTEITTEIVVVEEKDAPEFANEGIPTSQGAVSDLDPDSSQKKISLAEYKQKVAEKYVQSRGQGLDLSVKDVAAIETIIAERIPLRIVLQGIDNAFADFKPAHKRDKIRSLNYCVPIIFDLYAKYMQSYSKPRMVDNVQESQEPSPTEQSTVSDKELQELLSRMKSGGDEHEQYSN